MIRQAEQITPSDAYFTPGSMGTLFDAEQKASPLHRLHMLLRGRYILAAALGMVCAVAAGGSLFLLVKPKYESLGAIGIKPVVPRVLYQSEDSRVMPMFDAFVGNQVQLLSSERVMRMAINDDRYKPYRKGDEKQDMLRFEDRLRVGRSPASQFVAVQYQDENPAAAEAAVRAVIASYMQIHGESDAAGDSERLRVLETRKLNLTNQLANLRDRILAIANEYGTDALDQIYEYKLTELYRIEQALKSTQLSLASAGERTVEEQEQIAQDAGLTRADAMAVRQQMLRLQSRRQELERQHAELSTTFGSRHREVQAATAAIASVDQQIDALRDDYARAQAMLGPIAAADPAAPAQSIDQLRSSEKRLRDMHKVAKEDTLQLGRKRLEINKLKDEERQLQTRLEETRFRMEQLSVESAFGGRISVVNEGSTPLAPVNTGKRYQLAVLGGMAGGMAGVGLILLAGLIDRRLRSSDDAQGSLGDVRLLGMLPRLSSDEDLADGDRMISAGYCVHHIRSVLQLRAPEDGGFVVAVTGSASGTGKTSLSLATGLSFASSGSRTLLIDCDMVGGGLSARLDATIRRRIGAILKNRKLVNDDQLEAADTHARANGIRLGEALRDMGLITQDDIDSCAELQADSRVGLLDALSGEAFENCVTPTGIEMLDILPVGGARAEDSSKLTAGAFAPILDIARQRYQTIILDTGPVPGSVETVNVAPEADQVVLVVSRHDDKNQTARALSLLKMINARVAGWVFNRADTADMARSAFSASASRVSQRQDYDPHHDDESVQFVSPSDGRYSRFDPIAKAVVSVSAALGGRTRPNANTRKSANSK